VCCNHSYLLAHSKVSDLIAANQTMEDPGPHRPTFFQEFELPWHAISFVAKYLPSNPIILEAGAYDGKESCTLANHFPNGHVYSFEPVTELYSILESRAKGVPNISTYRLALGDECTNKIMYLSTEKDDLEHVSMSSSLFPPKEHLLYSGTLFQGGEIVKVTTINQWAHENGIPKIDMLWLDLQGYELPALKGASDLISNVSVILTELEFVEAYENQPLYKEIKAWLEDQGFTLVGGTFSFPKAPNQWFADGIFVRNELLNLHMIVDK
jgi:FkbM family methyltransferase